MGFNCGIVGLPNVGKSTLFNALTKAAIPAQNYPFCTIDPNVGRVYVPDTRLTELAAIAKPEQVLPTTIEFIDIAGLVEGASKGEGLGNQFLGHIRNTDAIAHVVRCFEDPDIIHVGNKIDPLSDIETIHTELLLADLDTVERGLQKSGKRARSADAHAVEEKTLLENLKAHLNGGKSASTFERSHEVESIIKELHLLTDKPLMYIANVKEQGFKDNPHLEAVITLAKKEGRIVVPICAAIEAEVASLPDDEKLEFLKAYGLEEPGLNRLIRAGYTLLNLQTFFTVGPKEVRAWTFHKGATAPEAAGVIHSDFEKGFIRAEIISFDAFVTHKGEQGAKDAGKWRLEGKTYIVQDGDVIYFRFNV